MKGKNYQEEFKIEAVKQVTIGDTVCLLIMGYIGRKTPVYLISILLGWLGYSMLVGVLTQKPRL